MIKCIHCFRQLSKKEITKDHIFPKSWFPLNTPSYTQRWTVPSCEKCNQELKSVEEELFIKWGSGLNPQDKAAFGIDKKVRDLIDVIGAKDDRIKRIRAKTLQRFIDSYIPYDPQRTLKGLAPELGIRSPLAVRLPNVILRKFGEKIIKGLEYKLRNRLVENRKIRVYYAYHDDREMKQHYDVWEQLIAPVKKIINLEPAFLVEYGINAQIEDQIIFKVKIWNHIEFWGAII